MPIYCVVPWSSYSLPSPGFPTWPVSSFPPFKWLQMLPLTVTVAETLGPPAAATSSCISLQDQPTWSAFPSHHRAADGGKAGLELRVQLTNNAPRLIYCPRRGNCCRWWEACKNVSWGCCQVVAAGKWVFFPLFTLWVKRGLYWNQDKTENLAVFSQS